MKRFVLALAVLTCSVTGAAAVQCYEAKATVNQSAPSDKCTQKEKGYANTGKGPLTHAGCTAAKNQAANKLRMRLSATCRGYVQTFASCTVINVGSCN
ncbi:MAG TPA: hypothetical protein VLX44_20215 [Xanthobacteraceae bacterium]|nr:hypothetical protein [Xanthobacteraceae bacterium]